MGQSSVRHKVKIRLPIAESGRVRCLAENSLGSSEAVSNVIISDLTEALVVTDEIDDHSVSVTCSASTYKYNKLHWYKNGVLIDDTDGERFPTQFLYFYNCNDFILEFLEVDVTLEETPYSHRTKLAWDTRENSPSGEYLCEAQLKQGGVEEKVWRRKETVLDDDTNAIKKISPNNKWNFFANLFN